MQNILQGEIISAGPYWVFNLANFYLASYIIVGLGLRRDEPPRPDLSAEKKGAPPPPPPARAKLFRFIFIDSALGLDSKGEPFAADIRVSYFQKVKNDQAVKKCEFFVVEI